MSVCYQEEKLIQIEELGSGALSKDFFERPTILVTIDLIGKLLVHKTADNVIIGKIIEAEAYLGETDPACHASKGKTERTKIFWQGSGLAYVFVNYGIHYCLNAITGCTQTPGCALIRAVEPKTGILFMMRNRGTKDISILTNGPGKLTKAFGITKKHNGADLTNGPLRIMDCGEEDEIVVTSRIGISKAQKEPLRFCISTKSSHGSDTRKIVTYFIGHRDEVKNAFQNGIIKVGIDQKNHNW